MPTSTDERRFVSTQEAADALGVSTATVYRMLDAGELDYVKVRSLYRIPKEALGKEAFEKEAPEPTAEAPRGVRKTARSAPHGQTLAAKVPPERYRYEP